MARCAASRCGPVVALGLDRVEQWLWPSACFVCCGWGREVEEHHVPTSRPASSHPVSDESKQSMVEIEQELLQWDVKLDWDKK